ncbi:energy transducer TonB [Marinifilum flexuosum]|uniref:energy transducer TonB n=1 Tax=Marinifilum flexuosum TaxID=1117708 RepID=UPI00249132F8|nr:energy transducer TonB [Marinifilum flexuosum]
MKITKTSFTTFFSFTLLLISTQCFGQKKYKRVKHQITHLHKEIYQVDKKSKIKEGFYYVVNTRTKDTLVTGEYLNNKRIGIWKFYKKDSTPHLEYDYDRNQLASYNSGNRIDSTFIKKGDKYVLDKVDNPQIYIGFENQAEFDMIKKIKLPTELMEKHKSGSCLYSFIISKEGILKDITIEQSINKNLDKNAIKTIKELNYKWEPARQNGKPIDSKSFLLIEVFNHENFSKRDLGKVYFWHHMLFYRSVTTITRTN